MSVVDSISQLFVALVTFIGGGGLAVFFARKTKVSTKMGLLLYVWHTLFCLVFLIYTLKSPADSIAYFSAAVNGNCSFEFGTNSVSSITCILVVLNFSYLACFLFFNILGSIGLLFFYSSLKQVNISNNKFITRLSIIIIFLPSISFWSAAIGKDAMSFLSVSLALWSALDLKRRKVTMGGAIFFMLLVRPHVAAVMVLAIAFSTLIDRSLGQKVRIGMFIISLISSVVVLPFALKYAGLGDDVTANSLQSYIEKRQSYNLSGGGAVDIQNMSLPGKVFTYMFRPLPYEAHSITSLISSIDNVILLLFFIYGAFKCVATRKIKYESLLKYNLAFIGVYALVVLLMLSLTTANLGIAMRQKWMFMPMFLFLIFYFISQSEKILNKRKAFRGI
ncbi:hypothetical protein RI845_05765 [Thalassotalea nanhaiensis]|uniref:Uncharacterized protein n=1 Tax=Thalassotalea nanhaiensis TaxID=3065648 RepID=A0ABY9TLE2_9GAMM|nr:hypothetical protein RI845_05765 [Colwelliaceae bacterium SQ345]